MSPIITREEVKKHNNERDIWIIIHNEVYDVTKFLDEHPGGADSLMDFAGKDGTQGFEDVGHSDDAREMMKQFRVGQLDLAEHTKTVDSWPFRTYAVFAVHSEYHSGSKYRVGPNRPLRISFQENDEVSLQSFAKVVKRRKPGLILFISTSKKGKNDYVVCQAASCGPVKEDKKGKSWRTFDGSRDSKPKTPKSEMKSSSTPRAEPRVQTIVVPRERRRRPSSPPPPSSSKLKWAIFALGAAILIGIAVKKYMA